jgi:hypothetical protein
LTEIGGETDSEKRWDDLLTIAIELGLSPAAFWLATPREIALVARARARHAETETRRALAIAWHAAAFQRVEKLPPLEDILRALRKPPTGEERDRGAREHDEIIARMQRARVKD